ncbi:MAG: hypothetical protein ACI9T7_003670 [Oleiphilaceae bacterium]|jgi:hypothetical protein
MYRKTEFAQANIKSLDTEYIILNIVPRLDKYLPEMQYSVVGKRMNHAQAEKYLVIICKVLDEFEGILSRKFGLIY